MKKMLLVLLFGMLCFSIESNAKTFAEFQADCERNPFSQLYYIDITYGGCDAKMLVCGNYMNSPGMY
ncbi:MAG: hypothetical protein NTW25_06170, partial [Candidatus Kapabacteria bacterium]|nr:hypothetical protein [Candidatus Kapabacteria bacterium]